MNSSDITLVFVIITTVVTTVLIYNLIDLYSLIRGDKTESDDAFANLEAKASGRKVTVRKSTKGKRTKR